VLIQHQSNLLLCSHRSIGSDSENVFHFIPGAFVGVLDGSGILGTIASVSTSAARTITTLASTPETLATSTPSPSLSIPAVQSKPPPSSASGSGRIVGLAVGIPLEIIAIAAAATAGIFMNRLRRERKQRLPTEEGRKAEPPNFHHPRELEGRMYASELPPAVSANY
jgi:hypothetical protein